MAIALRKSTRPAVVVALLLLGCGGGEDAPATPLLRLRASGGRVSWYKGTAAHERIAFDAIVDDATQNTEVFVMNPDGSGLVCVTCAAHPTLPAGFVGQPEWHPDGEHLVVQAENVNSGHTRYNHLAWGIDQDLWLVRADGSGAAEKIVDNAPSPLHAALHPHFDESGTRLLYSERIATGVVVPGLVGVTPGGENPWAGWQLHLAQYDAAGTGTGKLTDHVALFGSGVPRSRGFYESHGFFENRILYSATAGGAPYVDDSWSANLDGSGAVNLTGSPTTWEEHGSYAPSGGALVFISSRVDPGWSYPGDDAGTLRTELYVQRGADVQQLTTFNEDGDPGKRYLTSDFDWDRAGRRIVLQVAPVDAMTGAPSHPEIWMFTFPAPQ